MQGLRIYHQVLLRLSALNDRKGDNAQYFGKADSPRGLKISTKRREEKRDLHGERDGPKRRLVNSYVYSVRSDCEALTRRANTKKKKTRRRRWKRCRTRSEARKAEKERERERKPGEVGERERSMGYKARKRLFKVRCKLRRPSAASIDRLFVHPPTQKHHLFHLIKTPPARPDSLTTLSLFEAHSSFLSALLSGSLWACALADVACLSNRSYPEIYLDAKGENFLSELPLLDKWKRRRWKEFQ